MSQEISDREVIELNHQIAYAERQFVWQQGHFQLNMGLGKFDVARRFLEIMQETNDFIDNAKRKLQPGTRD